MAIVLYDTMLYIWCSRCKESKTIHLQGGTTMAEKVKYITVDKQEVYENEIKPLVDHLKSLLCHYEMKKVRNISMSLMTCGPHHCS